MNWWAWFGYSAVVATTLGWFMFIVLSDRNQRAWERMQSLQSLIDPDEKPAYQIRPRR